MNILINASNLKVGGGLQVANMVISNLYHYPQHYFVVIVSDKVELPTKETLNYPFIRLIHYNKKGSFWNALFQHDVFLDTIVEKYNIERVFTIFGPSYWRPKVKHICGFAFSQYIYRDSPFWTKISLKQRLRLRIILCIKKIAFKRSVDYYITENSDVTRGVKLMFKTEAVSTVTNYYNPVFDNPLLWNRAIRLPAFDGTTLLTIAANYPHKNLDIIREVCRWLNEKYKGFKYRFVITIDQADASSLSSCPEVLCIGKVTIDQCPFLYEQSDLMFLPTLLECFSASYPEAMRMRKPIMTSDLGFAKGLCGEAAIYFNPLNAEEIADKIYQLSNDDFLKSKLVAKGIRQLKEFDDNLERMKLYMHIATT